MALEVLVVDDEADIRELVSGVLEDEGYTVRTAADSNQTLDAIEERRPSMVLLDVWLQGSKLDGLQLLQEIKQRDSTIPVLVISGHGRRGLGSTAVVAAGIAATGCSYGDAGSFAFSGWRRCVATVLGSLAASSANQSHASAMKSQKALSGRSDAF